MIATPRPEERGFTLIEVMVSLGLFALIAMAGLGLVDGVMGVQGRTEEKLDRTAAIQRAMFVIGSDFDQVSAGAISGGGSDVALTRSAPGLGGPPVPIRYRVAGGQLTRIAGTQPQLALGQVQSGQWRFLSKGAWSDRWPIDPNAPDARPDAVAITLTLPEGVLRKVVALPASAKDFP